tara:strand:+ start:1303 stop:3141 length:1839 start_codon:yes stop_codon:yes gene_type:complete
MAKEVLELEVKSNIKKISKDTEILQAKLQNTKLETKELIKGFGAFGVTVGGVKQKFADAAKIMGNGLKLIKLQAQLAASSFKLMFGGKMKTGAKVLFSTIKAGIAATGIGLLVVAFASLVQYFKDSEEGASKFKQITATLGVVVGNVTDIISDLGKAVVKLITGDWDGFKLSLAEVTDGVKNFGETTRKEMGMANQLQKDRLALQKFERKAIVEKAKTEKDMMELRLKARDFENNSAKERLEFMRQANKLADEQLKKDLKVAKEKLRFQIEENSYSKSTQQNLDDEAALRASVFNIERSNFSERKRLKSEEQAIVKEIQATNKTAENARIKSEKQDIEALAKYKLTRLKNETDEAFKIRMDAAKKEQEQEAASAKILEALAKENLLAEIDNLKERALKKLEIEYEAKLKELESHKNFLELKAELDKKFLRDKKELDKMDLANEKILADAKAKIRDADISNVEAGIGLVKSLAGENKDIMAAAIIAENAVAISKIIMSTQTANAGALASPANILLPGSAAPIIAANNIAAGIAIAASVAAAAQGLSALGEGGATGGDTSTVSSTSAPPAPQMMSGAFDLTSGQAVEPLQAYVVSDDITNSQNKLAIIRRRATI